MRYMITGIGMVGTALAERLAKEGHDLVLYDIAPPDDPPSGEVVKGDLRDLESVISACRGVDGIFHTAALHGIHSETNTPSEFMHINVMGTFNVLEAARINEVKRVVFSSTGGVIGSGDQPVEEGRLPQPTEDTPCIPYDYYGTSKLLCERLCEFYSRAKGVETVALRYGGVRQLIARLVGGRLDLGWALSGLVTEVADCATANVRAMELEKPPPRPAYIILPTTLFDNDDYFEASHDLQGALLKKLPWLAEADLPQEIPAPQMVFDASVVETDLGFQFAYGQEDFIKEALGLSPASGEVRG